MGLRYIITIYVVHVVYMARHVMILRGATSLLGALEGVGPENRDFFDPLNCPERSEGQFRGQKNYIPQFLKQRDIGNFMSFCNHGPSIMSRSLNSGTS